MNEATVDKEKDFTALGDRVLWLTGEISEDSLWLVEKIFLINMEDKGIPQEKREPIKIIIFSPGGDLDTCYSIIDAIELSQTPVYTYNIGESASAAAFIFLAGDRRFMSKNAHLLFHKGSAFFRGEAETIINHVEYYETQLQGLVEFVVDRTKFRASTVRENMSKEWYLGFKDAVANGACDEALKLEDII